MVIELYGIGTTKTFRLMITAVILCKSLRYFKTTVGFPEAGPQLAVSSMLTTSSMCLFVGLV